jgi:hypothetical protein
LYEMKIAPAKLHSPDLFLIGKSGRMSRDVISRSREIETG